MLIQLVAMNSNIVLTFIGMLCIFQTSLQYMEGIRIILCRSCGADISSTEYLFSKPSPKAYTYFNDTLFDKEEVLIETFLSDPFLYPVITFRNSTCLGVGEWEEETSWYPGYLWKPCVCPVCGSYIGWVFEPVHPGLLERSKTFYGLILKSLISESCKYD